MKTESIQGYAGDEDCFSIGRHHIPNQYFKCPKTGIEMNFLYRIGSGWGVSFPGPDCCAGLHYKRETGRKIPFPETPKKYAKEEKEFYIMLEKLKEGWQ